MALVKLSSDGRYCTHYRSIEGFFVLLSSKVEEHLFASPNAMLYKNVRVIAKAKSIKMCITSRLKIPFY